MAKKSSRKKTTKKTAAKPKKPSAKVKKTSVKAKKSSAKTKKNAKRSEVAISKRATSARKAAKSATPKRSKAAKKVAGRSASRVSSGKTSRTSATSSTKPAARKRVSRLTAKDLGQFRQMLLEKRAELVGDVTTLHSEAMHKSRQDAAGDLSSMPIHMADLGTDNYEQEFTLSLIEGEQNLLREIDEALDRIAQGTYGFCLATGHPIGKARLRAQPWAKYCYEYMLAQEKRKGGR